MDGYGRWCCRYGLGCLGLVGWQRDCEGCRWSPSKGSCGVKEFGVGVEMEWSGVNWSRQAGGAKDVEQEQEEVIGPSGSHRWYHYRHEHASFR
jgi:hypothetical protein